MVPKFQLSGSEIENFEIEPLLLDIVLTLRAETSRVAVVLTGPVDPKADTGSLNHMVVFQFSADQGRWIYINPPGFNKSLDAELFRKQGLHEKSEYKVYSLQAVGPKIPKSTGKNKENFEVYNEVLAKNGGRCSEVLRFLKLPKWPGSKEVFQKMELLTTASGAQEREAYYLNNVKLVDKWLGYKRSYGPDPRQSA